MSDQKVVEEGAMVRKGDVIVRLTNPQLNMQILTSEADLAEKENLLRNTRVSMEQEKLNLQKERLQLEMDVARAKRKYEQYAALHDENLTKFSTFFSFPRSNRKSWSSNARNRTPSSVASRSTTWRSASRA